MTGELAAELNRTTTFQDAGMSSFLTGSGSTAKKTVGIVLDGATGVPWIDISFRIVRDETETMGNEGRLGIGTRGW